jgi:DNA-binding MarR family transcriptional regulator
MPERQARDRARLCRTRAIAQVIIAAMDGRLPLSSLLSQTLVAFTIEFDNEFEHQVPHRTTNHGATAASRDSAPWLVSMTMWLKFMRFVPCDGISVLELQRRARFTASEMRTWLTRMGKWWGYVVVGRGGAVNCPGPSRPGPSALGGVIRPTPGGRKALEVWQPLTAIIEERWRVRFGQNVIDRLQAALEALVHQFDLELSDYLPILGPELFSQGPGGKSHAPKKADGTAFFSDTLPALLAKVLLAFAIEFERDSSLSLASIANVLRLVGEPGARLRDLPRLSGVSKEAIAMAVGRLEQRGFAVIEPESTGRRVKTLRLTPKGQRAQDAYRQFTWAIEQRWQTSYGKNTIASLRGALEHLAGQPTARLSPLFRALEPYSDGWRAAVPRPESLPHYPMVLHRGGFPDGS